MGGENINNSGENTGDERAEWQSLGHKIAEQIASHTTTDKNGEPVYLGREMPEEMRAKVEETGFVKPAEEPHGTAIDGEISTDSYPRLNNESKPEYKERIEDIRNKTKDSIQEKFEKRAASYLTDNSIDKYYQERIQANKFYDRYPSDEKKETVRKEVREIVNGNLMERHEAIVRLENSRLPDLYNQAYYTKIAHNDSSDIKIEDLEDAVFVRLDSERYRVKNKLGGDYRRETYSPSYSENFRYFYESPVIAQELLNDNQRQIFQGDFNANLPQDESTIIRANTVKQTIQDGVFLPDIIKKNPDEADNLLAEVGIDKYSDQITWLAINGYDAVGKRQKKRIAGYFDLDKRVAEMMDGSKSNYKYRYDHGKLYHHNGKQFPPEISQSAIEKLDNMAKKLEGELNNDPEFLAKAKETLKQQKERKIAKRVATEDRIKFGDLLDTSVVKSNFEAADAIVKNYEDAEGLRGLLSDYMRGKLELEVDVDYKKSIQDGLKNRLAQGMSGQYGKEKDLTSIFRTDEFINNADRIGIDFTDEKIFDIAFDGFIKTLEAKKGEKSDAANWYYENIFSNDTDRFLANLKTLKEDESTNRGLTTKINRFVKENDVINAHKIQEETKKKRQGSILDEYRAAEIAQVENVTKKDIENIVAERQQALVNEAPFDFGVEKGRALLKYYDFVEMNIPNGSPQMLVYAFPGANDDPRSYLGFEFNYEGKRCMIAESLGDPAAMYLSIADEISGFECKDVFKMARYDADRHPNVAVVDHLDKEHFDDDLDGSYQKAFMFFRTGNKEDLQTTGEESR